MKKITAAITGVGHYVPENILSNADLEKMVDTNDHWIRTRTGIEERRILKDPNLATSDLGVRAVQNLIEKSGKAIEDVELTICATVTGDMTFPDTATTINYRLGIHNAYAYDLNAACSGFLFALTTAAQYIESGRHKKVLVVGADAMSRIVDYTDRNTCILFGDAGAAVLLEANEEGLGLQADVMRSDGAGRDFLNMKAGGSLLPPSHDTVDQRLHFVFQDGRPVFKAAVKGMQEVVDKVVAKQGLDKEKIDWIVPHQANKRIIEAVANHLDFPMERVMVNIHKYGNTTAATIPMCLSEWEEQLKKGDNLILTAFGGGFTWGAIHLTWAYDK